MTWIVSLSVECGADKNQAVLVGTHFESLSFDLVTGKTSTCYGRIQQDNEKSWWVRICPDNITKFGVSSFDDVVEISELGFRMYKRLMSAPAFRYALFGHEVDAFRTYHELAGEVSSYPDGRKELSYSGLVLREDIWEELGRPGYFVPFAEGYHWHPYPGEWYSPLNEGSEYSERLKKISREIPSLIPESEIE